jgi:hypothetical protein
MSWKLANDDRAAKNLRDEQMARDGMMFIRTMTPREPG